MTNIIDFNTRKTKELGDCPQPVKFRPPTHFNLNRAPTIATTPEDVLRSMFHSFREGWEIAVASCESLGLQLKELEKHEVTLPEVKRAIKIATHLKNDQEATAYFERLLEKMLNKDAYVVGLKNIPETFRGYVWLLNFQPLFTAEASAERKISSKIGRPIIRHVYF